MSEKRTGLGRGLTSLLGEDISVVSELKNEGKNIKIIPVEQIKPGSWQARKNFDANDLEDLSNSIKSKGILSPILVTKSLFLPLKFILRMGSVFEILISEYSLASIIGVLKLSI